MTKEEAMHKAQIIDFQGGYTVGLVDKIYNDFDVDIKLAQKIIEEHGNRTCKNCSHDWCGCSVQDSIWRVDDLSGRDRVNLDDFGCNKFEAKDD